MGLHGPKIVRKNSFYFCFLDDLLKVYKQVRMVLVAIIVNYRINKVKVVAKGRPCIAVRQA